MIRKSPASITRVSLPTAISLNGAEDSRPGARGVASYPGRWRPCMMLLVVGRGRVHRRAGGARVRDAGRSGDPPATPVSDRSWPARKGGLTGGALLDDYLTMYVEHGKPGQLAPGQFERIAKALSDPRRF